MVSGKGRKSDNLNPAEAFRKSLKAKELRRNKKERLLRKEASKYTAAELKGQLKQILAEEESGNAGPSQHLRKRAIQEAYEKAVVDEMRNQDASIDKERDTIKQGVSTVESRRDISNSQQLQRKVLRAAAHENGEAAVPASEDLQKAFIAAPSTVVPLAKAYQDKKVTSMVPAAVFHQKKKRNPSVKTKPGAKQGVYGLIPTSEKKKDINEPSSSKRDLPTKEDDTYSTFLKSMRELGAL